MFHTLLIPPNRKRKAPPRPAPHQRPPTPSSGVRGCLMVPARMDILLHLRQKLVKTTSAALSLSGILCLGSGPARPSRAEDGCSRSDNPPCGSQCQSVLRFLEHSPIAMTSSPSVGNGFFGTLPLPRDVEHRVHEFLRIAEVCALKRVSKTWHVQVRDALRHKYMWDLYHNERVDGATHIWLEHVSKAGIKTRSLRLVRVFVLTEQ